MCVCVCSVCVCVCVCVWCIGRGKCGLFFSCLVSLEWKVDGNIQSVSRLPRAAVCAIITSTQGVCVCVCVSRGSQWSHLPQGALLGPERLLV